MLMWLVYLYFIREAIGELYELGRDWLAWEFSGAARPTLPAIKGFLDLMANYALVIAAGGALLILWARYNQYRFSGKNRRLASAPVTAADLAARYGFRPDDVEDWHQARILVMTHDPNGLLIKIATNDAPDRAHV